MQDDDSFAQFLDVLFLCRPLNLVLPGWTHGKSVWTIAMSEPDDNFGVNHKHVVVIFNLPLDALLTTQMTSKAAKRQLSTRHAIPTSTRTSHVAVRLLVSEQMATTRV